MIPVVASLDGRLCLALYTASRAMTGRYRPVLASLGLTYPQYLVMVLLWEQGTSSVGAIGSRLQLDTSTLSPLLKRLESAGFVTRTRGRHDERTVLVALTPTGDALRDQDGAINAAVCSATGLSGDDMAGLVVQLRELANALDA